MVYLMQTATSVSNGNYGLGCRFTPDLGFGHGGAVAGYLTLMFYNPDTDVSMAGCLPLWDMSDGMHTLVRCNQGLNDAVYRSIESLGYPRTPILAHGVQTNLTLTAGVTNTLYVNAVGGACYAFIFSNAAADVYAGMAPAVNPDAAQRFTNTFTWPCMTLGTYRLSLTTTADTPCSLTLTGLKLPQEADYSDLDWTQAFNAAHETFSRQYAFTDWKSVDWGALYSNTLPRIVAVLCRAQRLRRSDPGQPHILCDYQHSSARSLGAAGRGRRIRPGRGGTARWTRHRGGAADQRAGAACRHTARRRNRAMERTGHHLGHCTDRCGGVSAENTGRANDTFAAGHAGT
jgi:hypothetical protein